MLEFLRQLQARDDERLEALRVAGGLLVGVGALVLAFRRGGFADPWGDFPLLLVALLPAVLLYGGGMVAARAAGQSRPWHSVFVVFGLFFVVFSLFQFLELIGGNTGAALNVAWVFLVLAAAGAVAALRADVRFGWLVAGIALVVSWLSVWSEILGDDFDDTGTFRGLCALVAGLLLVLGFLLHRSRPDDLASPLELATAGGLAFLLGTGLVSLGGVIAGAFGPGLAPLGAVTDTGVSAQPSVFWDSTLLVGSLALVGLGSRMAVRGPTYVGGLGLIIFVILVGSDLDDSSPSGAVVGWPLLLLVAGAAALAASVLVPRALGHQEPPAAAPAPPAPPPEPPQPGA